MREKKEYIIITFKTTTSAMAMEKQCQEKSIPGRIIPLPTQISVGCGLSWRMLPEEYKEREKKISRLGISFEGIYSVVM